MKTMRKITALLLALAMVLAMTLTVSAAGTGSITINSATVGETYKAYKVFDATTSDDNVAYTYTKTGDADALYAALADANSPFSLAATADASKFNVSLKDGINGSEVAMFLKSIEDKMGTAAAEVTATSTTVEFTGLDYGYYYIAKDAAEQPGPTVGVTSVAPAQTINDKSTKPGPWDPETPDPEDPDNPGGYKVLAGADGKAIGESENTANYGETVYFILQAEAVNYDDGKKIVEYTAYDVLGEGFKEFSVTKVTVNGTEISNYTVDTSTSPATITIPWVDASGNHLYAPTSAIKIYCQAVVDEDAVIGETGSNTTNIGWFGWEYDTTKPNPDDPDGPEIPETGDGYEDKQTVTTKVYAIAINKTDSKGNALEGANFEIYKGEDKIPVTLETAGDATNAAVYKYDADSTNYTVVSPASGKIVIKGLASGDYTVKETVAPAGYNLLTEGKTIAATEFSSSTTEMTLYYDDAGNLVDTVTTNTETVTFDVASAAINVINLTGAELPSTGGMGTTLFYAFGSVLVLAAVVLLVTKKRMAI